MKINILLIIIFCSTILSCDFAAEHNQKNIEGKIFWDDTSILNNKKLISYIENYAAHSPNDIRLFIGQYRDTTIVTISSMKMDINIKQNKALGYMEVSGRKVFILMPISRLLMHDSLSVSNRLYQKSVTEIVNAKNSRIVLLKIPMSCDTMIEVNDINSFSYYFMPTIKSD